MRRELSTAVNLVRNHMLDKLMSLLEGKNLQFSSDDSSATVEYMCNALAICDREHVAQVVQNSRVQYNEDCRTKGEDFDVQMETKVRAAPSYHSMRFVHHFRPSKLP